MAMKTVLRRLCKTLPSSVSPRFQKALALDEQAEHGLKQNLSEPFLLPNETDTSQDEIDEQALADAAREAENKPTE
jgi:recombinational DNA repair protein RecT